MDRTRLHNTQTAMEIVREQKCQAVTAAQVFWVLFPADLQSGGINMPGEASSYWGTPSAYP